MAKKPMSDWLFQSMAAECNPDLEIIGQYTNSKKRIKVKCKLCGLEYEALPKDILDGRLHKSGEKCRWCTHWHHKSGQRNKILEKLKYIDSRKNDFELLKPYEPVSGKIECKCKKCGKVMIIKINHLSNPEYSCPHCLKTRNKNNVDSIWQKKVFKLFENNNQINLLEKANSSLKCQCRECNAIFNVDGYMKKRKITCPICYKEKRNALKRQKRLDIKNT